MITNTKQYYYIDLVYLFSWGEYAQVILFDRESLAAKPR